MNLEVGDLLHYSYHDYRGIALVKEKKVGHYITRAHLFWICSYHNNQHHTFTFDSVTLGNLSEEHWRKL